MEFCAHLWAPVAKALAHPGMSGLVYLGHLTNSSFFLAALCMEDLAAVMYVMCQFFWAGEFELGIPKSAQDSREKEPGDGGLVKTFV